jgi:hypothetical protein
MKYLPNADIAPLKVLYCVLRMLNPGKKHSWWWTCLRNVASYLLLFCRVPSVTTARHANDASRYVVLTQ